MFTDPSGTLEETPPTEKLQKTAKVSRERSLVLFKPSFMVDKFLNVISSDLINIAAPSLLCNIVACPGEASVLWPGPVKSRL